MTAEASRYREDRLTASAVDRLARPPAGLALDALRLLREWIWLRALLLVIVFAVACTFLGRWQWSRHLGASRAADRLAANYNSAPDPLAQLLPTPESALPSALEWHRVRVAGAYLPDRTVLIRNRALDGNNGYEVVVPLRTSSSAMLLVDRGWVPEGATGAGPAAVPAPPSGQVVVVARLRPGEPAADRSAPPGQAVTIDLPRLTADLGAPAYRAYGVLDQESPKPANAPQPLTEPTVDLGLHLAYALQWWVFAVMGFVLLGYFAFRESQNRDLRARGLDPVQVRKERKAARREPEEEDW
jgi:cytochrome oxidase assembly protein ShyY1